MATGCKGVSGTGATSSVETVRGRERQLYRDWGDESEQSYGAWGARASNSMGTGGGGLQTPTSSVGTDGARATIFLGSGSRATSCIWTR
jgi:hypothetical protein